MTCIVRAGAVDNTLHLRIDSSDVIRSKKTCHLSRGRAQLAFRDPLCELDPLGMEHVLLNNDTRSDDEGLY